MALSSAVSAAEVVCRTVAAVCQRTAVAAALVRSKAATETTLTREVWKGIKRYPSATVNARPNVKCTAPHLLSQAADTLAANSAHVALDNMLGNPAPAVSRGSSPIKLEHPGSESKRDSRLKLQMPPTTISNKYRISTDPIVRQQFFDWLAGTRLDLLLEAPGLSTSSLEHVLETSQVFLAATLPSHSSLATVPEGDVELDGDADLAMVKHTLHPVPITSAAVSPLAQISRNAKVARTTRASTATHFRLVSESPTTASVSDSDGHATPELEIYDSDMSLSPIESSTNSRPARSVPFHSLYLFVSLDTSMCPDEACSKPILTALMSLERQMTLLRTMRGRDKDSSITLCGVYCYASQTDLWDHGARIRNRLLTVAAAAASPKSRLSRMLHAALPRVVSAVERRAFVVALA